MTARRPHAPGRPCRGPAWLILAAGSWLAVVAGGPTPAMAGPAPAGDEPAEARFSWAEPAEPPLALHVAPREVSLGEVVAVVVEGRPGSPLPEASALRVDADWLERADGAPLPDLSGLPAAQGPRLVVPWRVYRLGPWRALWQGAAEGVDLTVRSTLEQPDAIVPVRDPGAIGGLPRWAAWLLGAVLAAGAWWLLRRRFARRGPGRLPRPRPLPPPPWLQTVLRLQELERLPASGDRASRIWLDRLASILRGYVQSRFHLPALEMTAPELAAAGEAAGWPAARLAGFCRLLADCDHQRYAPPPVGDAAVSRRLAAALDCLEAVRIEPTFTAVPPDLAAEAAAAWTALRQRYPRSPARTEEAPC